MEDEDGVVNELIQRSCQEIVDHINANELILRLCSKHRLTFEDDQQATVLVNDVFEEEDETVTGGIVTRNGVDREATSNSQHYTVSQDIVEPDTGIVATKPQDAITASTTTTATTTTTTTYKTGSLVSTLGASLLDKSLVPLPNMISLKLILLGNSGVGKTSLIQRFLQNKFLEAPTTIGSAHGTCYIRHTLWKVNIKLSLWDTAGQEKFDWITPNYLKAVNVALIVFDMTDQEKNSLRSVGDWRNQLHQQCQGDIPIVLVGNKSDSEVMADKIKKHAKHVVEKSGLKCFIETSAKSGYQVEKVFETAISLALEYCNIPKPDVPELDTITGCNQTLNQDERTSCCKKCEIM
ncbi:ras-related protein Rab-17-like isoform X2 [Dysidea avara]|uniref:ras-related protein Rab-17-like isoform X2 n=1 Tax=Dysidea avara TaxID=196820 RepID=UPI003323C3B0